jgi:hypothetical protein
MKMLGFSHVFDMNIMAASDSNRATKIDEIQCPLEAARSQLPYIDRQMWLMSMLPAILGDSERGKHNSNTLTLPRRASSPSHLTSKHRYLVVQHSHISYKTISRL